MFNFNPLTTIRGILQYHLFSFVSSYVFIKVCQSLTEGPQFSPRIPVFSTSKTDRHDIIAILLKVALNTIKSNQTKPNQISRFEDTKENYVKWYSTNKNITTLSLVLLYRIFFYIYIYQYHFLLIFVKMLFLEL